MRVVDDIGNPTIAEQGELQKIGFPTRASLSDTGSLCKRDNRKATIFSAVDRPTLTDMQDTPRKGVLNKLNSTGVISGKTTHNPKEMVGLATAQASADNIATPPTLAYGTKRQ